MKSICFYHDDLDGMTGAAVLLLQNPNCIFKKINYNYDFEKELKNIEEYEEFYLIDFSFPSELMKKLYNQFKDNFYWFDHHISAKEKNIEIWNNEKIKGLRNIENSGCKLVWKYYMKDKENKIINYVEDIDLWKLEFLDTKAFIMGLTTTYKDIENLAKLIKNVSKSNIEYILDIGNFLLLIQKDRIEKSFKKGKDIIFEGHKTRIINNSEDISELGEYIYKEKEYPIALIWFIIEDKVICSLRSNSIDVRKIAEKYEGGGHISASGFTTNLNFILKLYGEDN